MFSNWNTETGVIVRVLVGGGVIVDDADSVTSLLPVSVDDRDLVLALLIVDCTDSVIEYVSDALGDRVCIGDAVRVGDGVALALAEDECDALKLRVDVSSDDSDADVDFDGDAVRRSVAVTVGINVGEAVALVLLVATTVDVADLEAVRDNERDALVVGVPEAEELSVPVSTRDRLCERVLLRVGVVDSMFDDVSEGEGTAVTLDVSSSVSVLEPSPEALGDAVAFSVMVRVTSSLSVTVGEGVTTAGSVIVDDRVLEFDGVLGGVTEAVRGSDAEKVSSRTLSVSVRFLLNVAVRWLVGVTVNVDWWVLVGVTTSVSVTLELRYIVPERFVSDTVEVHSLEGLPSEALLDDVTEMVVRLTVSSTENDDVNVSSTDCVCVLVHEYDAVAVTVLENEYVNDGDRSFVSDSVRDTEIVTVAVSVISVLSEGVAVRADTVIVGSGRVKNHVAVTV